MFEVACPSCKATYQVDERRVPASGLKMRCPKCGESFQVAAPGAQAAAPPAPAPVLGAALGLGKAPAPKPTIGKSTVIGVAPGASGPAQVSAKPPLPAPRNLRSTMIGVAPQAPAVAATTAPAVSAVPVRSAVPARPAPPARTATPGAAPPRPAPPRPIAPAVQPSGLDLDLAEEEPAAELADDELEAELPSLPARAPSVAPDAVEDAVAARRRQLFPSVEALDFSSSESGDELTLASTLPASDELDLDAERVSLAKAEPGETVRPLGRASGERALEALEIDLPSIPPSPAVASFEVDLPSPVVDLPATPHRRTELGHPTTKMPAVHAELPALVNRPSAQPSAFDDLPDLMDLPAVHGDLPALTADLSHAGVDLPDLTADLPIVGGNLPVAAAGLPSPGANLPMLGGLPDPAAGLPGGGSLPDDFSSFPKGLRQEPSIPPGEAEYGAFDFGSAADFPGQRSLHPAAGSSTDDEGEFDAFPTERTSVAPSASRTGGIGYGEVALDGGGGGGIALEEEPERPVAPTGPFVLPPEAPRAAATASVAAPVVLPEERKRVSRGVKIAVASAVALTVAGGALALLPDVGPYGSFIVIDALKANEHGALVLSVKREADQLNASDSVDAADRAFKKAEAALESAPRYKPLRAYAAYVGFVRQIRFGRDASSFARAQVLLDSLAEVPVEELPYLRMARAARAVAEDKRPPASEVKSWLSLGAGLDGAVLVGETALASGNGELALRAWTEAAKAQTSARTAFGLARAQVLSNKPEEAKNLAASVLEKTPQHPGAILLLARLRLGERGTDEELQKALEALLASGSGASRAERVDALNVLGRVHLLRSRVTRAEESFNQALALQADSTAALLGLGDAFFASGRNAEALARYEAAAKVDPENLPAQLGLVRSKLALESLADAAKLLDVLVANHPKSTAVAYWFGRAKELVGEREAALEAYRRSTELAEDVPELVSAYAGMTRLLGQLGQTEEATRAIEKAVQKYPDRPEIYVAMGDLATNQANYERAVEEYDKALALDPEDIGIHFKRGVALRRARNFASAEKEFTRVSKEDPEFPGLALEWGLLYEASGRAEDALVAYEGALKKAPEDADLMLRVGCGKANAGQTKAAEELLRKVLEVRPNSAETNHCLGRAILLGGGALSLRDAMRYLERAVVLDANRAEHHLYVGWAANELNDPARASQALTRALELDQTLADAYWQRGVLRGRQGAVRDAVLDLQRALALSPTRYEAHASLADAYFNLGREQEALSEWSRAIARGPAQPVWHFRYGKLLFDNRRVAEARVELQKAVDAGKQLEAKPLWLWEAHRLLALTIGRHPDAVQHWQAFVVNADSNSPYRAEALRELKALGQ